MRFTTDSDGQTVKTEASKRLVPLHPDLIELGLWGRVERLREAGEERLFPGMRVDSKAGTGNAISKGFGHYLKQLKIGPRRANGTVGFHSLRKTVIGGALLSSDEGGRDVPVVRRTRRRSSRPRRRTCIWSPPHAASALPAAWRALRSPPPPSSTPQVVCAMYGISAVTPPGADPLTGDERAPASMSMYFEIQRIAVFVAEAAAPRAAGFDPAPRLRVELQRVLRDVPEDRIPPELRDALLTGLVLGAEAAARWLPG